MHVITGHASANKEFQDLESKESVKKINKEKPTRAKQLKTNRITSNSADGVVLRFEETPTERKTGTIVAAKSSNDTKCYGPKKRNKRKNKVAEKEDVDESEHSYLVSVI